MNDHGLGDLFAGDDANRRWQETIAPDAVVLRGFALDTMPVLLTALHKVLDAAPARELRTPGGRPMSVRTTSCGALGWVSDARGYRYESADPLSGKPWPDMPAAFQQLAQDAAATFDHPGFDPDACLINGYRPGTRMGLHQDRDEQDFTQPIVSVSLGLPAVFRFGGPKRGDPARDVPLRHGDVVVWGRSTRLHFHGVRPLKPGHHPDTGEWRWNLTFRRAR
jgi:alkylated DNA repair protein (DNA oxidative demethylase)